MSQTSVIFFGLLVGFIVFVTIRGELPAYLQILGLSGGVGISLPGFGVGNPAAGGGSGKAPSVIPYDPNIPYIK